MKKSCPWGQQLPCRYCTLSLCWTLWRRSSDSVPYTADTNARNRWRLPDSSRCRTGIEQVNESKKNCRLGAFKTGYVFLQEYWRICSSEMQPGRQCFEVKSGFFFRAASDIKFCVFPRLDSPPWCVRQAADNERTFWCP